MNNNQFEQFINNFKNEAYRQGKEEDYVSLWLNIACEQYSSGVPVLLSPVDLSRQSGLDLFLMYQMANQEAHEYYRDFNILKRNNKVRRISAPLPNLKIFQSWVASEILSKIRISDYAKAYRKGYSLKENTKFHRMQNIVLKLDVKDFFPSLKASYVYNFFRSVSYPEDVAIILTNLVTLDDGLPQGAPSSPVLSNILMEAFDNTLSKYCKYAKIRYTRYADDLTFSGDSFTVKQIIHKVEDELSKMMLTINRKKIRVLKRNRRQIVTGILVNNAKVAVPRSFRRQLRLDIYHFKSSHQQEHMLHVIGHAASPEEILHYCEQLIGRTNFVLQIDPENKEFQKSKQELIKLQAEFKLLI